MGWFQGIRLGYKVQELICVALRVRNFHSGVWFPRQFGARLAEN